mgnify:CR=1 FL=1
MSFNVAIDGPAGAGKSTVAKSVAALKNFIYVDTGAMYRAMALYFLRKGIDKTDESAINAALGQVEITIRYEDEAPEVMKAETHPAVLSAARLLTSVMRLDAAALRDAFDFTLVGGEKPADAWTITLRARDEALGRILGTVTLKGSEYVESIRMSPSNDNVTDMILSNVRIVKGA